MRPRDFLDVLENRQLPRCAAQGEHADALRTLLVHLFFIDHDLDKRELVLLERVLPEGSRGRDYVKSVAARKLDLERVAQLFPDAQDRQDILELADHAAWGDEKVVLRERTLLDRLTDVLGIS
jgi:hypothetical protein